MNLAVAYLRYILLQKFLVMARIKNKNKTAHISVRRNRPKEAVHNNNPYFRNSIYGRWCGLNCLHNILGKAVVTVKQFNKECRIMAKRGDTRQGVTNRGSMTTGMDYVVMALNLALFYKS